MKLLLIAGMGESVALARELCAIAGHEVICVTEGRAVARAKPPAKIYDGKFEQDADFAAYVTAQGFDLVIDAAHPFEFRLGRIAQSLSTPYLRVCRPAWTPQNGEEWSNVPTLEAGIKTLGRGQRVFLATGRGSVAAFDKRPDLEIYCRQLSGHDHTFTHPKGRFIFGEGPFSKSAETFLFHSLNIDALMLQNSGSLQGRSKVGAAHGLGIKVIMIERPYLGLHEDQMATFETVLQKVSEYADH